MTTPKGYIVPHLQRWHHTYPTPLTTFRATHTRLTFSAREWSSKVTGYHRQDLRQGARGSVIPNFYDDLYRQVIVMPRYVDLGSISTDQTVVVYVWNANRKPVQILGKQLANDEGVTLTGPILPKKVLPLALTRWVLNVSMQGPPLIHTDVTWTVTPSPPVIFRLLGSRSTNWPFASGEDSVEIGPNWEKGVTETLEFLTAVHTSYSGAEQRVARRLSPRRTFEFEAVLVGVARQFFENVMYAYGSRVWSMPVFTDRSDLLAEARISATSLILDTIGRDFIDKGQAILLHPNGQQEMVEITTVESGRLRLKRALQRAYPIGTRIYPIRSAMLTDPPAIRRVNDSLATAQVRFAVVEHNGFSNDISHLPTYRGFLVLEPTSEWSEDVTSEYQRLIAELDNQTGKRYRLDTAQKAFQVVSHHFVLSHRDVQRQLRQLFYYLRGRQKPIWVATSSTDFTAVSDLMGTILDVRHCGYSATLRREMGRTDVRIELCNGDVIYRRIITSNVVDDRTERLAFEGDSIEIKQQEIAKMSFMTLSRLESDTISWQHKTDADGIATVMVNFRAVREELEQGANE
ncbi:MAG: phage tail protein [Pasteurellaceae bacterium]|nr:phage tail protein [Pasteurellaceae bacterium]